MVEENWDELRQRLIGFGEQSSRKSYFPELQRKLAELEESEQRFRLLVENSIDVIFVLDEAGVFQFVSPSWEKHFGYPANEVDHKNFELFAHPDDILACSEYLMKIMKSGEASTSPIYRVKHRDGSWRQFIANGSIYFEPSGAPRYLGIGRDITEQLRSQEAIRDSEAHYRLLTENVSDVVWRVDADSRFSYMSPADERLRGYTADEVIGHHIFELFDEEGIATLKKMARERLERERQGIELGTTTFEARHRCKDGRWLWAEISSTPERNAQGVITGYCGISRDITERKQLETYKEMSREVLQILNETRNVQNIIESAVAVLKARTGFAAVGIRLQAGEDFPYFAQEGFTSDFLQKENSLLRRSAEDWVCRDEKGNVDLECTCGLIISEKTDPANPLFTRGGSFWTNDSCQILDIPSNEDPRLFPRNECVHAKFASVALVPIRYNDRTVGLIQFNDHSKGRFTLNIIEIFEGIALNIGSTLLRKRNAEEKARLEHQFQQAQKLESLGVLAGGIAHDFNNILTVIMGHCYMAREDMIPEDKYKATFQKIETAGDRAKDLCRQMLTYAGKSPLVQTQVNLWLLIDEVVKMLQAAIKKNVTIETDLRRDVPEITGDTAQIQQIIMNLIINAAEAIGETNGTIRVKLTKAAFEEDQTVKDIFGTLINSGRYGCLEVADTGCGMDEATMKHIFEPFFTTKSTGRGLGMSAIHGIIKSHDGAMQLTSKPGVGTTFKVFFPIPPASEHTDTALKATVLTEDASGTILLVEDEQLLRVMGKELLDAHGFTTMTASNGSEALEIYRERGSGIDVILLDLVMPVMGGIEAYHELRRINPIIPIIICSGYGVESVEDVIEKDPHAGFMHKPYNPGELRDMLVRMMK